MKPCAPSTESTNTTTLKRLENLVASGLSFDEAKSFEAGRNCGFFGPDETNCHFAFFRTAEMTAAWERGKRIGTAEKY